MNMGYLYLMILAHTNNYEPYLPRTNLTNYYFIKLVSILIAVYKKIMNSGAIELQAIQVDKACENKRCECWTYNVSDQFPIKSIHEASRKAIVEVGPPHEGYTIETSVINNKINGKAIIRSPDGIRIATLVYVDGVACGYCKLYDELGILYFKGYMENGYRHGRGTEYDENGNLVFDGFYEKGEKRNIYPLDSSKRYWIEYDDNSKIINISQRDNYGQFNGKCYFYDKNGVITRISECEEGRETNVIKQFIGNKMIEYNNGVRCYEGCYRDSFEHDYFYEGEGKEYGADGQTLSFHGNYYKGKRHGMGLVYRNMRVDYRCYWHNGCIKHSYFVALLYIISLILAGYLSWYICDQLISIVYIFIICIAPLVYGGILSIPACAFIIYLSVRNETSLCRHHSQTNYSNLRNETNKKGVAYTRPLNDTETIDIYDECFPFASEFRIDGLNQLKTIKIGINSFTQKKNGWGNSKSKSFHILNCESLEYIQIGRYSFSDFAGQFELKNLPQLQSIQIGTIGSDSCNFWYSSFVIRGIYMILNIWMMHRSSKSAIHYTR